MASHRRPADEASPRELTDAILAQDDVETFSKHYKAEAELRKWFDLVADGRFLRGDRGLFRPLGDSLLARDDYFVLADFAAYSACQERVARRAGAHS